MCVEMTLYPICTGMVHDLIFSVCQCDTQSNMHWHSTRSNMYQCRIRSNNHNQNGCPHTYKSSNRFMQTIWGQIIISVGSFHLSLFRYMQVLLALQFSKQALKISKRIESSPFSILWLGLGVTNKKYNKSIKNGLQYLNYIKMLTLVTSIIIFPN